MLIFYIFTIFIADVHFSRLVAGYVRYDDLKAAVQSDTGVIEWSELKNETDSDDNHGTWNLFKKVRLMCKTRSLVFHRFLFAKMRFQSGHRRALSPLFILEACGIYVAYARPTGFISCTLCNGVSLVRIHSFGRNIANYGWDVLSRSHFILLAIKIIRINKFGFCDICQNV